MQGSFAWADDTVVPLSADNGKAIYKVVFTPNDTKTYSVAEALIAVNTQTGVNLVIELSELCYVSEDNNCIACINLTVAVQISGY